MLIITRYFTKEFLKTFVLCMSAFVAIYIMVDLFENLGNMIEHHVSISLIVKYFLYNIPMIVFQVAPLGMLLCTFITLGIFVRNQEITALKAHGISLYSVLKVFIVISLVLCLVSLWLQEYILPYTNSRAKEIKTFEIKGKERSRLKQSHHFWYRIDDKIYNIDFFDQDKKMLQKISILTFGTEFSLDKRIDAEKAFWSDNSWIFKNGQIREFHDGGDTTLTRFEDKTFSIHKTPQDFAASRKEGDEMSISQISDFIKQIRREGYSSTPYEVDMHAKISYSFIIVIMAILGIPFALQTGRSGGMALGITISITLGFVYWTFFAFCISLGKGGSMPPFLAAWIANVAFGSLGLYMFLHVRQ